MIEKVIQPGLMGDREYEVEVEEGWHERDTYGKGELTRFYTAALGRDKRRQHNVGQAIAGDIQHALALEISYIRRQLDQCGSGRGEHVRRQIKRLYGLPCWGNEDREAAWTFYNVLSNLRPQISRDDEDAFEAAHPDHTDYDNYWDHPGWPAWMEAHPDLFNEWFNDNQDRILHRRDWFADWNSGKNHKAALKQLLAEKYWPHLEALDSALPRRYYLEAGLPVPARTSSPEEDMADALHDGDWDKLIELAEEKRGQ